MGTWLDTSLMRSVTWAPDSTTPRRGGRRVGACVDSPQCSRSRSVLVHLDYTGGTLTTHENWEEGAGSIGQGWLVLPFFLIFRTRATSA